MCAGGEGVVGMTKRARGVLDTLLSLVVMETRHLSDREYLEVLGELEIYSRELTAAKKEEKKKS